MYLKKAPLFLSVAVVAVIAIAIACSPQTSDSGNVSPISGSSSSLQADSSRGFKDMIRQQHMKCESVLEVRPAETGQDVVICEDQGDEYVYKIPPGANSPVISMIDYHSGSASATTATSIDTAEQPATQAQGAATSLIEVAPATEHTMRLLHAPKDNADVIAERAADDPNPDASNVEIINDVHIRNEHIWEEAFADSVLTAFRQAAARVSVPFEYPIHSANVPDGYAVVQLLANAVLRANLRCDSIYTVDSLRADHGWRLMCDHKRETYAIRLVGQDWKLAQVQ
jgi:hypothetical protein